MSDQKQRNRKPRKLLQWFDGGLRGYMVIEVLSLVIVTPILLGIWFMGGCA